MIKKLLVKLVGKKLRDKWKLDEPEKAPHPGAVVISVPWYRSKAKVGTILYLVSVGLEHIPPMFNAPPVRIPKEVLDFLEALGLGTALYGIRDAQKEPAKQLYENPKV